MRDPEAYTVATRVRAGPPHPRRVYCGTLTAIPCSPALGWLWVVRGLAAASLTSGPGRCLSGQSVPGGRWLQSVASWTPPLGINSPDRDMVRASTGQCMLHPQLARAVVAACRVEQERVSEGAGQLREMLVEGVVSTRPIL